MSVWYVIPSKRSQDEAASVLQSWRAAGYRVAIQRDPGEPLLGDCFDVQVERSYAGYAEAVNYLCRYVLIVDPQAEWLVTGGDDILPDSKHKAVEIGQECSEHFLHEKTEAPPASGSCVAAGAGTEPGNTFGVMQPTGDREFGDKDGPYIERVAGSPWMGRDFCRRMYGGRGPLCEVYFHMGEDEELQAVATRLGIFWQRPDLIQRHNHWGRPRPGERLAPIERMPEFLQRANSVEEWKKYKRIFAERQAAGFPGHEPLGQ